jgi:anthranilate phosphoribosyltransferase
MGPSDVTELKGDGVERWTLDPRRLGIQPAALGDVAGGTPEHNAKIVRRVLEGAPGPERDIVVLNAAAGLVAAGRAGSIEEGMQAAAAAVDEGAAAAALDALVKASNSA